MRKNKKYSAKFAAFQQRNGLEMTEGRGGQYSGVSIKRILKSENILQDLKAMLGGAVGEAVYQYLKVTLEVYLLCTKPEVDPAYPKVLQQFKQKFLVVQKLLKVSLTLKLHVCIGDLTKIILVSYFKPFYDRTHC